MRVLTASAARVSVVRVALLALAGLLVGVAPSLAGQDITLRVNDVDAPAGSVATVEIRTYSPRPVGQGQIRLSGGGTAAALTSSDAALRRRAADGLASLAADASRIPGSPFAELLGLRVYSEADDALSSARVEVIDGQGVLVIDFSSASGTINSSDGPMIEVEVRLRSDLVEGQEFEIAVDLGSALVLGPDGAPLEVRTEPGRLRVRPGGGGDDAPAVAGFTQRGFQASESQGQASITVTRSGDDGAASVRYVTFDGTATAGSDYTSVEGVLTWAAGDDAPKGFLVPVARDGLREGAETVEIWLLDPQGATLDPVLATATLTLLDEVPPTTTESIRFAPEGPTGSEASAGLVVGVVRSGDTRSPRAVTLTTEDGAAVAGMDYVATTATVTWGAGESGRREIVVPLIDDTLEEGSESILVRATGLPGPDFLETRATILDDDLFAPTCTPTPSELCLQGGRFRLSARWSTSAANTGTTASGRAVAEALSDTSGTFWFFDPGNVEILVKVVDGCQVEGLEAYWVFFGATTNVGFVLTVTDLETGLSRDYENPIGQAAVPVTDTGTFAVCP